MVFPDETSAYLIFSHPPAPFPGGILGASPPVPLFTAKTRVIQMSPSLYSWLKGWGLGKGFRSKERKYPGGSAKGGDRVVLEDHPTLS